MIKHISNFKFDGKENVENFLRQNRILYTKHSLLSGGVSTYSCAANLFKDVFFKNFCERIISLTDKYPIDMWSNIGYPGTYVKPHKHYSERYPNAISGVYYLQKPTDSGNLVIEGDVINVKSGDLVLFGDAEMHWTEKNESNKDRIVISFNLHNLCYNT